MKQYNDLVLDVLENGSFKPNARTGKGTLSVFGCQVRFDLQKELPLVTSKYTNWQALKADSNLQIIRQKLAYIAIDLDDILNLYIDVTD